MTVRFSKVLNDHLRSSQYCGVPGNSILDAATQVRDAIAYSETTATPLCVLSLDFQNAFDRISHQYLFQLLQQYGITIWFIERIKALYNNATASVQNNGCLKEPIHIQSAVRQGCPLTIRDGRHAKHRQNGRGVLFTPWGIFILYNATSPF
jgi:hypothetical protein